jgi:RNA polymerase sigma-70 factor (family 1)
LEERISYLLERISTTSDQAAYRELYEIYFPSLYRFACGLTRQEPLAEEIVSDVFINIWKGRETLTSIRNMRVYLFVAVKNLCVRALSRMGKEVNIMDEEMMADVSSDTQGPDDLLISREMNEAFENAVAALPERCKLIFQLVREEGLRYREIAIILNISHKTVEAQMTIATRQILKSMPWIKRPSKRFGH